MAKKTHSINYKHRDDALSTHRDLLCYENDADDIYWKTEAEESISSSIDKSEAPTTQVAEVTKAATENYLPVVSALPKANIDTPVTAEAIVISLVASKLQKPREMISTSMSIKQLVAGRSYSPFSF